jgi:hypothetical protein
LLTGPRRVGDAGRFDASRGQLSEDVLQVVHPQRQVLAAVDRGLGGLHEVDLAGARLQPRAREVERWPVQDAEAEAVDVEPEGLVEVVDVDGHVVDAGGLHRCAAYERG